MIRNTILDILTENEGEFVSGERLSQKLNMSRAAVWKHVNAIKERNYEIESVSKKGYRLVSSPNDLDEWALSRELDKAKLSLDLNFAEEVASTNEEAKQLAKQTPKDTLIIARKQNAGKGRQGSRWESPQGGLWLSLLLHPKLGLANAPKATLGASVAVVETLSDICGIKAGIKWPNDIVYKGRKLAGILGEVNGEWNSIQSLILGIGINGNYQGSTLSEGISSISLLDILGSPVNLNQLARSIAENTLNEVEKLQNKGFEPLRQSWTKWAIGVGQDVKIMTSIGDYYGVFEGIDVEGALCLRVENEIKVFTAAEVHLRSGEGTYTI